MAWIRSSDESRNDTEFWLFGGPKLATVKTALTLYQCKVDENGSRLGSLQNGSFTAYQTERGPRIKLQL